MKTPDGFNNSQKLVIKYSFEQEMFSFEQEVFSFEQEVFCWKKLQTAFFLF